MDGDLERARRIVGKLEEVRSRGLSCFGSDHHGFRLNPPIAEAEVAAFEAEHGVRLPSAYRAFLIHAGNGGAGPYYGIDRLDKLARFADWVRVHRSADFLARPCPLRPGLDRSPGWADRLGAALPYQGMLEIGTRGCTYEMRLIVTGACAGMVAYVDTNGSPPYVVREPDFLAWYERWLDELLAGYSIHSFGFGPGGGEDDFFRILEDPGIDDEYRGEAAWVFCRLPSLSEAAASRILGYGDDPAAPVRAGVCSTIRTFPTPAGGEVAARLLDDPDPKVREAAVQAVLAVDARRWIDGVVRRLRDDPDKDVATTAFFGLGRSGALDRAELLRILDGPPRGQLRYFAASRMEWKPVDVERLLGLLDDPATQVRATAAQALGPLGDRVALPRILDRLSREDDPRVIDNLLGALGRLGDPAAVPTLLEWARAPDDFHRIAALEVLAQLGDDRAVPVALDLLRLDRPPRRRAPSGGMTGARTMGQLARESLSKSPSRVLRALDR